MSNKINKTSAAAKHPAHIEYKFTYINIAAMSFGSGYCRKGAQLHTPYLIIDDLRRCRERDWETPTQQPTVTTLADAAYCYCFININPMC